MKYRWTMSELRQISTREFLRGLINERKSVLNSEAPLYKHLSKLAAWVETYAPDSPAHLELWKNGSVKP